MKVGKMESYICDECGAKIPIIKDDELEVRRQSESLDDKIVYSEDEIFSIEDAQKYLPYINFKPETKELSLYLYDFDTNRAIIHGLLKKIATDEIKNIRVTKMKPNENNSLDPNEVRELFSGDVNEFLDYMTTVVMTSFGE